MQPEPASAQRRAPFDPRVTPARPDLAAEHLRGQVEARRFVPGIAHRVAEMAAPVRDRPDAAASLTTEALFGETVTVYDRADGWAWGQIDTDGYVGWLPEAALAEPVTPTHRVVALRSFVYPRPSIRQPPSHALSLGSRVAVDTTEGSFARLATGGFVFLRHLGAPDLIESDPVAVASWFVGVPYLWGGRTSLGLDCSGLVQAALLACGQACPRDSDMQETALGTGLAVDPASPDVRRGDLLFWRGHVAWMSDERTMLHANATTMSVAYEDLAAGLDRIARAGDPLRAVRRLQASAPHRPAGEGRGP